MIGAGRTGLTAPARGSRPGAGRRPASGPATGRAAGTVNLVANGTVALLSEPGREQWRALARDPGLAPGPVGELLRYDSPVQLTSRTATEDADVGGTLVPEGTQVITG